MIKVNIAAIIIGLIWVMVFRAVIELIENVKLKNMPGYSVNGDFIGYFVYPAGIILLIIIAGMYCNVVTKSPKLLTYVLIIAALFLPIYLISIGAGV